MIVSAAFDDHKQHRRLLNFDFTFVQHPLGVLSSSGVLSVSSHEWLVGAFVELLSCPALGLVFCLCDPFSVNISSISMLLRKIVLQVEWYKLRLMQTKLLEILSLDTTYNLPLSFCVEPICLSCLGVSRPSLLRVYRFYDTSCNAPQYVHICCYKRACSIGIITDEMHSYTSS